jgi:hypothetical protein
MQLCWLRAAERTTGEQSENRLESIWCGSTAGEIYFGAKEVQPSRFSVTLNWKRPAIGKG